MRYAAQSVFTPGSFPQLTYVARRAAAAERELRDALLVKGQVISIIGPSKSGKTVLVESVAGETNLIAVSGAVLRTPEDLWSRVLDSIDVPTSRSIVVEKSSKKGAAVEAGGGIAIPFVAEAKTKASGTLESGDKDGTQQNYNRGGLQQVIQEISGSEYVVLLDDFHYVDRSIQDKIAQEIKEAARRGVKIVVVSVPHREDDVIRANPDLRGRVTSIDLHYWKTEELEEIGHKGFGKLNVSVPSPSVNRLALEAAGSPQLMQAICLNFCFELDVRRTFEIPRIVDPDEEGYERIFRRTSAMVSYASLLEILRRGPKERGQERAMYPLKSGVRGDVYECILRAMKADPPRLDLPYSELKDRIESLCVGDTPRGVAITKSVAIMNTLAKTQMPKERAIDWDDEREVLDIVDPYFLFFLRWTEKL